MCSAVFIAGLDPDARLKASDLVVARIGHFKKDSGPAEKRFRKALAILMEAVPTKAGAAPAAVP